MSKRLTVKDDAVVLDPEDEFEAILISYVKMFRVKKAQYASDDDGLVNFSRIARIEGITPLQAISVLSAKHHSLKRELTWNGRAAFDAGADDASIDDGVYAIIWSMMYERLRTIAIEAGETRAGELVWDLYKERYL